MVLVTRQNILSLLNAEDVTEADKDTAGGDVRMPVLGENAVGISKEEGKEAIEVMKQVNLLVCTALWLSEVPYEGWNDGNRMVVDVR